VYVIALWDSFTPVIYWDWYSNWAETHIGNGRNDCSMKLH